jgi:hypothetical protein
MKFTQNKRFEKDAAHRNDKEFEQQHGLNKPPKRLPTLEEIAAKLGVDPGIYWDTTKERKTYGTTE